ncbi:hypothetical protein AB0B10_32375 [Micromonospora arborensis]|uniref:hypothetical protein n=1 Tax=Micromonospora arborensis TaxID=2116518 RepID=UPI0034107219
MVSPGSGDDREAFIDAWVKATADEDAFERTVVGVTITVESGDLDPVELAAVVAVLGRRR